MFDKIKYKNSFLEVPYSVNGYGPPGSALDYTAIFTNTKQHNVSENLVPPHKVSSEKDDHTTGSGFFFWGDSPSDNCCKKPFTATAWSQQLSVTYGVTYYFSAWFKDIGTCSSNPADFKMEVNGQDISSGWFTIWSKSWTQKCFAWTANHTAAIITIQCRGSNKCGDDFGIDDIEFRSATTSGSVPSITVIPSTVVCPGQCVTLFTSGNNIFSWSTGSTTNPIVVCPTTTTTYEVASFAPGCPEPSIASVTINVISPPNFTITPPLIGGCIGVTQNFSIAQPVPQNTTFTWNFGDPVSGSLNTATGQNVSHDYNNAPGTYVITVTATNNCGLTTIATTTVTIAPSTSVYNPYCCSNTVVTYDFVPPIATPIGLPTIWNIEYKRIKNDLIIQSNCELIIQSSVIEFGPLGRITVMPGARLTVTSSLLRGLIDCGTMWQGIEVWGDASQYQTVINPATNNIYQGKLIVQSGTIIQDAHNAVVLGKPNGKKFTNAYSGGIIIASNSSFTNNAISIRFAPYYKFVNRSRVDNCTFSSTALLDPGYTLGNSYTYPDNNNQFYLAANTSGRAYAYINMDGVRGVTFRDNSFNNAEYGVRSFNSTSIYWDANNNNVANTFSNMLYGMRFEYASSTFYGNNIRSNKFDDAMYVPILINGGKNDFVFKNEIDPLNSTPNNYFVGIALTNSTYPNIIDNKVSNCAFGIAVSNSGPWGRIAMQNTGNIFTNCIYDTWVAGNNPYLQIKCNRYDNQPSKAYQTSWYVGGALADQGHFPVQNDKDPIGNIFVKNIPLRRDLYSTVKFNYYHHSADAGGNPLTVTPVPSSLAGNVLLPGNLINTGIQMTSTSCDPAPPCLDCDRIQSLDSLTTVLQTEYYDVASNLDNGQTQLLIDSINANTLPYILQNILLNDSPLSDDVLLSFINRIYETPDSVFTEVILANSPVSDNIRSGLDEKLPELSGTNATLILGAQSGSANRTLTAISREIQTTVIGRREAFSETIRFYADNDTTAISPGVIALLENENTVDAFQTLLATYIAGGNLSAAAAKLNDMMGSDMMPSNDEEQAFIDLQTMLLYLAQDSLDVFDMNEDQESLVRNIAGSSVSSLARSNARAILFWVFGEDFAIEFDTSAVAIRLSHAPSAQYRTAGNIVYHYLEAGYPNPATNSVFIPYYIPKGSKALLNIYDVNGKSVEKFVLLQGENVLRISTTGLNTGVYAYSIIIDGTRTETRRMTIIKNE